jgi:putative colanic acid biosynthesis glycosyltransferase
VITVVRNDAKGLAETFQSVRSQSFRDVEHIIVDGASTDGTAQLALSYALPGVIAQSEPDRGIFDAMNKGLKRATGIFVLFLNAGDVLATDDIFERLTPLLQRVDVDLIYGDSLEKFTGGRPLLKRARKPDALSYGMFCCHQAIFYRRERIGGNGYDTRFRIAGDYEFTARFLKATQRIAYAEFAICIFDLTGASRKHEAVGRRENWQVQRDTLKLSLGKRSAIRLTYLMAALLRGKLPVLYKSLRFSNSHD